jgi:hypothetical protein
VHIQDLRRRLYDGSDSALILFDDPGAVFVPREEPTLSELNDPTADIRAEAATLPGATEGTSCNQTSFKVGKRAFLYIGPGPKGKGYKAMFRLDALMPQARDLSNDSPERYEIGSTGWVTTRFTADDPLSPAIWQPWLQDSYDQACG